MHNLRGLFASLNCPFVFLSLTPHTPQKITGFLDKCHWHIWYLYCPHSFENIFFKLYAYCILIFFYKRPLFMFADKTVTHHTQGWSKMIRRSKSKVKVRKVSMAVNSPARKPVVSRLSRYPSCHRIMAKISLPHLSKGPCDLNPSVIKEKEPFFRI